jgi:hypothetical protein
VKVPGWPAASRVRVEVGNRITQQMIRLPSGESHGGEPEPDPLGLGFASSSVELSMMVDPLCGRV